MAIEKILVIESDVGWHGIYGDYFARSFPGVQVIAASDTESAVARAREQQFDLYTTNYPRSPSRALWADGDPEGSLLRARVAALRTVHHDAQIALLSARPRSGRPSIEALAQELGITYFAKQEQDFLQKVVAQYGGTCIRGRIP